MDLQKDNLIDLDMTRFELKRKESRARTMPYISFILTHAALVLFIIAIFMVDRLVADPSTNLFVKVSIVVAVVLLLAGEWIYAIISSLKWKKDIIVLQQITESQRQMIMKERLELQGIALASEQQRSRTLQFELEQQRKRRERFRPSPQSFSQSEDQQIYTKAENNDYGQPLRTWKYPD